jgi:hypothetical protein
MAIDNFESVPNKNYQVPDMTKAEQFSPDNGLGHIFKIVPEKDLK